MKIGIDISQMAFPDTGVAVFLEKWIDSLILSDKKNSYVFFFSSLRGSLPGQILKYQNNPRVEIKTFKYPPTFLDILWNKAHKLPIESFIGPVDLFITSDWIEPPAKDAKKATIIYDMIVYKYPEETHSKTEFSWSKFLLSPNIVVSQKRKLSWVKKESDLVFTISNSSKRDIEEILGFPGSKVKVIYPAL